MATMITAASDWRSAQWLRAGIIHALGCYALLMYGVAYYAVTTAAPRMAADFGIATPTVFGLLTVSLLLTAILAPRLGRWTDRAGAATVLLTGAVLRAAALIVMALTSELWLFALAFLVVQCLGQLTEYDATFAAAVDIAGDKARVAMSQITLWGGLASTVFWPTTAWLLDAIGWRTMLLVFAATWLVACLPIAALARALSRASLPSGAGEADGTSTDRFAPQHTGTRSPPFGLIAAAFAFGGVAYCLPFLMLPTLEGLGLGAAAVTVGMLFGPSQTAGRFFEMVAGGKVRATTVAVFASAVVALALAVLLIGNVWAGLVFAVLFGAGGGVGYVVRGSVVLELYGTGAYATWLGRLGTVRLLVSAIAPFVLSLVLETWGARAVVMLCGTAALVSLACFAVLSHRLRPDAPPSG
ncbi:MAG: MFS transporter [Hyphomicrobiaceae bacterium]|nr:MFS transporter [Hyphomicrobiaceae bacterium]